MANRLGVTARLVAGHPITGAYSADDATAHAQMTALNIEGPASPEAIYGYMSSVPFRSRPIWGAVAHVAGRGIGDSVDYQANGPDISLDGLHISAAIMLISMGTRETNTANLRDSFVKQRILDPLGHSTGCDCMDGVDDVEALQALSDGVYSHATRPNDPSGPPVHGVSLTDITDSRP